MESPPTYAQIQAYFEGRSQTGRNTCINIVKTSLRGLFSRLRTQDQSGRNRRVNMVRTSRRDFISKSDCHNSTDSPALRRKRSKSSPGVLCVGSGQIFSSPRDQSRSSSSAISGDSSHPQHGPSLRCPTTLTPEKRTTKVFDIPVSQNTHDLGKSSTALSKTSHHSSGSFFTCSRNVSSKSVKTSLRGLFSQSDSHNCTDSPALRNNSSMSSPGFLGVGSGQIFSSPTDQSRSSSSTISRDSSHLQHNPSLRCRTTLTPEKRTTKVFDIPASQNTHELGKSTTASSKTSHHSSGSFFTCSRNVSSKSVKTSLRGLFSQSDSHNCTDSPALRSNGSMSSPGFLGVGSGQIFSSPTDQSRSSSSTISRDSSHLQHNPSLRCRTTLTPENRTTKVFDIPASQNTHELGKSTTASSKTSHHSLGSSFTCSRNISSKIVKTSSRGLFSRLWKQDQSETGWVKTSPREMFCKSDSHNSTDSPTLRSNSSMSLAGFLGVGSGPINFSSPTDQCRLSTSTVSSELSFQFWVRSNDILDPYVDRELEQDQERSRPKNSFLGNFTRIGNVNSKEVVDEIDVELQRSYKEADERVLLQSQEIEQESFLQDTDLSEERVLLQSQEIEQESFHQDTDLSEERVLLQSQEIEQESFLRDTDLSETIRTLAEDTGFLAREVSDLLQSHIERAFTKEELNLLKTELECQTRRLGKEKTELQLGLERKLDSRLSKLEKYASEEQRLCEGVTELAEQNSFQMEVSSFNDRVTEWRSKMAYLERQFKELTIRLEHMKDENQVLRKNLSELQNKCTVAEEGLVCIQKQFEDKDKECKELHKSVTTLLRTRSQSRIFL